MKRKYTLRGMGLGIFVTALIFTIALLFEKPKLSDEEIIKEAKKLGMVEASDSEADRTADSSDQNADASSDGAAADGTNADGTDGAAADDGSASADGSTDGTDTSSDGTNPDGAAADQGSSDNAENADAARAAADAQAAEDALNNTDVADASTAYKSNVSSDSSGTSPSGLISVTISAGQNSAKVAENLYRAGLIDDPIGFNDYLEQNGYDATIRQGTYSIAAGSSYEKIANAIASKR